MNHPTLSTAVTGPEMEDDETTTSEAPIYAFVKTPTVARIYKLHVPQKPPDAQSEPIMADRTAARIYAKGGILAPSVSNDPWDPYMIMVESPEGGRVAMPREVVSACFSAMEEMEEIARQSVVEYIQQRDECLQRIEVEDLVSWPVYGPWKSTTATSEYETRQSHGLVVGVSSTRHQDNHAPEYVYVIEPKNTTNSSDEEPMHTLPYFQSASDNHGHNPCGILSKLLRTNSTTATDPPPPVYRIPTRDLCWASNTSSFAVCHPPVPASERRTQRLCSAWKGGADLYATVVRNASIMGGKVMCPTQGCDFFPLREFLAVAIDPPSPIASSSPSK